MRVAQSASQETGVAYRRAEAVHDGGVVGLDAGQGPHAQGLDAILADGVVGHGRAEPRLGGRRLQQEAPRNTKARPVGCAFRETERTWGGNCFE